MLVWLSGGTCGPRDAGASASLPNSLLGSPPMFGLLDVSTCCVGWRSLPCSLPQPWATSHCAAGATSGVHTGKDAAWLAGNSGLENMEGSARRLGGDNMGGHPLQLGSYILSAAHPTDSGRSFPMLNCFLFPSEKALGGLSALVSTQIHALQGIIPRCYLSDAA